MDYIAFIAGLPEIAWDDRKLSLTVAEFREQLKDYISGRDERLIDLFFLPNDNAQVLRLLRKQEPDGALSTVYPVKLLEDEIQEPDKTIPAYLREFIADFKEEHLRYDVSPENVLSWMYYDESRQPTGEEICRVFHESEKSGHCFECPEIWDGSGKRGDRE